MLSQWFTLALDNWATIGYGLVCLFLGLAWGYRCGKPNKNKPRVDFIIGPVTEKG